MVYRIYCITNTKNGKKYVGQTTAKVHQRWYKHTWVALQRNGNTRFYAAIRKWGKEAFDGGMLLEEASSIDESNALEQKYIIELDTMNPEKGYNMTTGGDQLRPGWTMSKESCAKISASKLGKHNTVRRAQTLEEDRPIVEAFKAGVSRGQIEKDLGVTGAKVIKALHRWKERIEPELKIGKEFQYIQSGVSHKKRADKIMQPVVDFLLADHSYKEACEEFDLTYGRIKGIAARYRIRCDELGQDISPLLANKKQATKGDHK